MISVTEGRKIIRDHTLPLRPVTIDTDRASGYVLAEDVRAGCDIPPFDQSAMDGYAILYTGWKTGEALQVDGEIPAGQAGTYELPSGKAARIFTGAPMPEGADTVVMQEKTEREGNRLFIKDPELERGNNVRQKGTEIRKSELALAKGTVLTPAGIGFLSGVGITEIKVFPRPSVAVIVTGNELQAPGNPLQQGQIYESNSFMLKAALREMGITDISVDSAGDNLDELTTVLGEYIESHDVVLLTGGVSVGDYDFVVEAASGCGITQRFHKLRQRPGKPLYFGTKGQKIVFGLPGNPSSVLTCFYEYVWMALQKLSGQEKQLAALNVPLGNEISKKNALTQFLKGVYTDGEVTPLSGQESFRMGSFAHANCLIRLGEEAKDYTKGEKVEIHLLPVYG
ncbi:molybdopterin molybdenumtransferase MoeA [Sinomicrobium pectinilyticum]|uniref:Molybdopterin molybdenumtransferase n=1 Tax=Sinomicrobium pectinilyticum TaxID=1084421 RepID=A0A3N0E1I2_SINP1|nr:gephyrin-like molybdotransferase Glp [Sinomicrobium pectinilyticum]RNL81691.1 molybdopterin molybdenumtransferase MoeA [Sinomicrobium pectinilyticum]